MARRPRSRAPQASRQVVGIAGRSDPRLQKAMEHLKAGRNAEAAAIIDPLVARRPKDAAVVRAKGLVDMRSGRYAAAEGWFAKAARLDPRNPVMLLDQASVHKYHGRYADMIAACREALKRSPGHVAAEAMLARALESSGDLEAADAFIREIGGRRSLDPDTGECLVSVLDLSGRHDEALEVSARYLEASGIPPVLRRRVLLRRGRILEKRGELDEALACFEKGHAEVPASFDPDTYTSRLEQVAENLPTLDGAGDDDGPRSSRLPVFIAGLPRSGTSLVERILGAHPEVVGIGESGLIQEVIRGHLDAVGEDHALGPLAVGDERADAMRTEVLDRCREFGPQASRVASKHLQNWAFLGTIGFWFPRAAVIRIERDPAANAISILGQDLPPDRMPWATRLDWIGRVLGAERRFVDAVRPKLPNPWLSVAYEDLVRSPETWIPRIVETTGLPWDDACLQPHLAEQHASKSAGARFQPTLSLHQVRQPITADAASRASKWGDRLGAFHEAFETDD